MKNPAPLSHFRHGARVCLLAGDCHNYLRRYQVIKSDTVVTIAKGNMITIVGPKVDYWTIPDMTILVISEDGQILAVPSDIKAFLVD